ncbi:hypothetical protein [Zobellella sp. An-6]
MSLLHFPPQRVVEINSYILRTGRGLHGGVDIGKLEGALGRIDINPAAV